MKKRLIGAALAAVFVFAQALTVSAAGSKEAAPTVSGDSAGKYEITAAADASVFTEVEDQAVVDAILSVNKGETALKDAVKGADAKVVEAATNLTALTQVFDLEKIGEPAMVNGKYQVTFTVSTLSAKSTQVTVLHYSVAKKAWEVITPDKVDLKAKTVTASFEDLSPVVVLAKEAAASTTGTSTSTTAGAKGVTSPKTGVASTWMMLLSAGVIFGGAAFAAYRKSRA